MLRICYENNVDRNMSVCLYTANGMPLTDDPFFNKCRYSNLFFFTIFKHRNFLIQKHLFPAPDVVSSQ